MKTSRVLFTTLTSIVLSASAVLAAEVIEKESSTMNIAGPGLAFQTDTAGARTAPLMLAQSERGLEMGRGHDKKNDKDAPSTSGEVGGAAAGTSGAIVPVPSVAPGAPVADGLRHRPAAGAAGSTEAIGTMTPGGTTTGGTAGVGAATGDTATGGAATGGAATGGTTTGGATTGGASTGGDAKGTAATGVTSPPATIK